MPAGSIRIAGHVVYCSRPLEAGVTPRAALLVRRNLRQIEIDLSDLCSEGADFVAVKLEFGDRYLTIVSAYVAPNVPWDVHVLADIRARAKGEVIIAGDFNAHSQSWGDRKDSRRGRELQAMLDRLDLRNITSGNPTFVRPGVTGSVIDLTFTTWALRLNATPQADSWGSDHLPIVIGRPPKAPLKTCRVVDWDRFRTLLEEALEEGRSFTPETLSRVLQKVTHEVRVPATRPNPDLKWLELRAKRRRAQRRSWATGDPADVLAYRRLDAKFRRHGKKLARRQWRLKCTTLDKPAGGSRAWRMARTLAGRPIPQNPVLGMAVAMNLQPTEMAELLADAFTEVPPLPAASPPPQGWSKFRHPTATPMQQPDEDFTLHELQHVLDALPRHRAAPGPDGITNQALRNVNESAVPAMLTLINHVWRTSKIPEAWREATTVPLLKPGKPQDQLSSYRPISLTSCLGKVMERMVLRRLVYHLEAAGALPDCFSGFRHHRSTADAIGDITSSLEEAKAQGWSAMAVFLDVRKAFDALPHRIIISALRRFGVCGRPLNYICAFLTERTMCVKVGGALSKPRRVDHGVPQGSVVSPLLFALAIASLPAAARVGEEPALPISMAVYADDVALWSTAPGYRRQRMARALQRALTNTVYHLHQLGLTTSAEKTVALCYAPRRPSKFQPTLFIGDVPVRVEKTVTYLGLTLDWRLSWGPATQVVLQRMRTHTNILRALGGTTWGTSQQMLLQLYKGLILARPLYALPLIRLSGNQIENLERAQRVALRICIGVPRSASSRHTLTEAGMNTVENLLQERALGHLIRMSNCDSTITLLISIAERTDSELGAQLCTLGDIAGTPGPLAPLPALHTDPHPLRVNISIPGLRTKKSAAVVTARQLTESHLDAEYDGRTRVFTDGSVDPSGGTATAAAFFEAAAVGIHERLSHQASSTTAELAAIRLALWGIRTGCARGLSWVVLSDSRSALGLLSELERATPLARSVAQDAAELREKGHEIIFQWIPSHCGIRGNEVADSLAAQAHKDPGCPLSTVPRFSDAKLLVRRTITRQNPDPRVADGTFSARLPRGLDRHTAAVLHRLRTGSAFTPAWIGRFRPDLNPNCQTCQETADAEHLLLHCTDYNDERTALHNAYSRLGLSSDSLEDLLHPRATRAVTDMALKKLITYMKDTELLEIL